MLVLVIQWTRGSSASKYTSKDKGGWCQSEWQASVKTYQFDLFVSGQTFWVWTINSNIDWEITNG